MVLNPSEKVAPMKQLLVFLAYIHAADGALTYCPTTNETCLSRCFVCLIPRPYDGSSIALDDVTKGAAGTAFSWSVASPAYADAAGTPLGDGLPSARGVTQDLYLLGRPKQSGVGASQLMPYWLLFTYYDMVEYGDSEDDLPLACGDGAVDEQCPAACSVEDGEPSISFVRAKATTIAGSTTRVPINKATAALDLSQLYGTSEAAAKAIRSSDGGGLVNLTDKGLPYRSSDGTWLLADQRVAQDVGTLALATLLLREHNRIAAVFKEEIKNRTWETYPCETPGGCSGWEDDDDQLFEAARMWTISTYQHCTLHEFMPSIFGQAPASYWKANPADGSDPRVDPLFAAVGSRWMWTAMAPVLRLVDATWAPLPEFDPLELRDTANSTVIAEILNLYGASPVLRGMMATPAREVDASVTSELTAFLTAEPTLDVQRARDIGIPPYNEARDAYGLSKVSSYDEISSDVRTQGLLADLYGADNIAEVDTLVGALAEDLATGTLSLDLQNGTGDGTYPSGYFVSTDGQEVASTSSLAESDAVKLEGSSAVSISRPAFGPLIRAIMMDQYRRSYQGDLYWHRHINRLEASTDYSVAQLVGDNLDPKDPGGSLPTAAMFMPEFQLPSASSVTGDTTSSQSVVLKLGVYSMSWEPPKSGTITLQFTIKGMNSQGYIALGLGSSMRDNADIMFVKVDTSSNGDKKITVEDRVSRDNELPKLDSEDSSSGTDNPMDATCKCRTVDGAPGQECDVSVTRKLDTGDTVADKAITEGINNVIWSFNLNSFDRQHAFNDHGKLTINFYTGDTQIVGASSTAGFFALHGFVMLIAYGICAPIAWIIARYMKHKSWWLEWHEAMGMVTAQSSIPIAAAAIASMGGVAQLQTAHGLIGLVLFILSGVQMVTGLLRMLGIENRGNKYLGDNYGRFHWVNTRVHRWMGRLMVPLALANVWLGLGIISPNDINILQLDTFNTQDTFNLNIDIFSPIRQYLYFMWICCLVIAFTYLEWKRLMRKSDVRSRLSEQENKPHFTRDEFDDRILQGAKWVIVHDMIIDIADYMKVHPGGSKIIKESIGLDVTKFLLGERKVGRGVFTETVHKHSPQAYAAMMPSLVGYLQAHDLYAEEFEPDRKDLAKGGGSASTASSASSRKGRTFGPSFAQFEVIRRTRMRGPGSKRTTAATAATTAAAVAAGGLLGAPTALAEEEERRVYRFLMAPKEPHVTADALRIGWYHKFRLAHAGHMVQRQYTPIASRLLQDGRVGYEFYIRLYPGGQMSEALRGSKAGAIVSLQGPFMVNDVGRQYEHIYMLAGGTGVTPMLQIARYHVRAKLLRERAAARAAAEVHPAATADAAAEAPASSAHDRSADTVPANNMVEVNPVAESAPSAVAPTPKAVATTTAASAAGGGGVNGGPPPLSASFASIVVAATAAEAGPAPGGTQAHVRTESGAVLTRPSSGKGWQRIKEKRWSIGQRSSLRQEPTAGPAAEAAAAEAAAVAAAVGGRQRRSSVMAAELDLLAADGGDPAAVAAFRPAATLNLLWQTRTEKEGFCLADLGDLSAVSDGAFQFTHYFKQGNAAAAAAAAAAAPDVARQRQRKRYGFAAAVTAARARAGSGQHKVEDLDLPSRDSSVHVQSGAAMGSGPNGGGSDGEGGNGSDSDGSNGNGRTERQGSAAAARSMSRSSGKNFKWGRRALGDAAQIKAAAADTSEGPPPLLRIGDPLTLSRELTEPRFAPLASAVPASSIGAALLSADDEPPDLLDLEFAGGDNDGGGGSTGGGGDGNNIEAGRGAIDADVGSDLEAGNASRRWRAGSGDTQETRDSGDTGGQSLESEHGESDGESIGSRRKLGAISGGRRRSSAAIAAAAAKYGVQGTIDAAALEEMLADLLTGVRWALRKEREAEANGALRSSNRGGMAKSGTSGGSEESKFDPSEANDSDAGITRSGSAAIQEKAAEVVPAERPDNSIIVVSGPPRFADGMQALLRGLGVPDSVMLFLD